VNVINEQDIKDIIIALIKADRLCSYSAGANNSIEKNSQEIIEMYTTLKSALQ
jgi:hypothetical protein